MRIGCERQSLGPVDQIVRRNLDISDLHARTCERHRTRGTGEERVCAGRVGPDDIWPGAGEIQCPVGGAARIDVPVAETAQARHGRICVPRELLRGGGRGEAQQQRRAEGQREEAGAEMDGRGERWGYHEWAWVWKIGRPLFARKTPTTWNRASPNGKMLHRCGGFKSLPAVRLKRPRASNTIILRSTIAPVLHSPRNCATSCARG